MVQIPFAVQTYVSRSLPLSAQRCVNFYAEPQPDTAQAKSRVAVFGAPGIVAWVTVGTGPIRAMHPLDGLLYVVSGRSLYSIDEALTVTFLGTGIAIGNNPVSVDDNGVEITIVDGTNGFTFNTDTSVFAQISDVHFYSANVVTYIDSYMMLDRAGTNQFFSSDSLAASSYDPLFFASAESQSDRVLAPINHLQQLIIAGETNMEIWFLAGGNGFPYARYQGAAIQVGMCGPMAWTKLKEHLFFLGGDRVAYKLVGAVQQRISNHGIEHMIRRFGNISDAYLFSLTWEGHDFVYYTFPTANVTLCFDATTGLWHERESWDNANVSLGRWRGQCYADIFSKQLIGDAFSNQIGYLTDEVYTEYGNTIYSMAISPPIFNDGERQFMGPLQITVEGGVGVADAAAQGHDPQMRLYVSDDGGRTWTELKRKSLGKLGAYKTRAKWPSMGSFFERMFKLEITDPVKRTIISAEVSVDNDNDEGAAGAA